MNATRSGWPAVAVAVAMAVAVVATACTAPAEVPPSTLFVTDYATNAIVRYDGASGELIDVFAHGLDQRVDRPASVRLGPSGHLYAAGFGRGDIVRYDLASGAMMDVFYWDTTLLEEPVELLFRGDELVVLGNDTRNAVVLDAAGGVMRSFGDPIMQGALDMALGRGDQLYVATWSHPQLGCAVQVWDLASGTLVRGFAGRDEVAVASGIAIAGELVYVADAERDRVMRFDARTGASLGALIDAGGGLRGPVSLDLAPDGALAVLDATGIHRFDRETGAYLSRLIGVDGDVLQRPLSFTFVTQ